MAFGIASPRETSMLRLQVQLFYGHTEFPSADERALGEALHLGVIREAGSLVTRVAQGTAYGSVYSEFELLKRDHRQLLRIIHEVLRELAVEHLAKITELPRCRRTRSQARTIDVAHQRRIVSPRHISMDS